MAPNVVAPAAYAAEHRLRVLASSAGPDVVSLWRWCGTVFDQKQANTCVANAGAKCVDIRTQIQGGSPIVVSRAGLNWIACTIDGADMRRPETYNHGTYPHSMVAALQTTGFAPETIWPYPVDDGDSDDEISWALSREPDANYERWATDQRSKSETSYSRMDSLDEAITALRNGFPLEIGGPVALDYVDNGFDPAKPMSLPTKAQTAGLHARVIIGFDLTTGRPVFEELGSYGPFFALGGRYRSSREVVQDAIDTGSLYAIEHIQQIGASS